jgi:Mrp family chromosome partitioning ATPase
VKSANKGSMSTARILENQCRQLAISVFFHQTAPVRSIGFTSSIDGEGKSFLSAVTAKALAEVSSTPVALVECNWHHATQHEYYDLPSKPGLAEWLRGECNKAAIRHQINHNLTVIPAGDGQQDAIRLLQQISRKGLIDSLALSNELLIVDLPAIITTHYGLLAASVVEALFIVVHAGVTPEPMITKTCTQLMNLPVQGFVLNQVESSIPGWIRQIL